MTKIAVVKADFYDPHIVDIEKYINPGERVLVKLNMLEGTDKASCITTHP